MTTGRMRDAFKRNFCNIRNNDVSNNVVDVVKDVVADGIKNVVLLGSEEGLAADSEFSAIDLGLHIRADLYC